MPIALLAALILTALAHAREQVVVLLSDDLPAYEEPAESFAASLGRPVQVLRIGGQRRQAERLAASLRDDPPPAIFALGAKAAWTAVQRVPRVPTVYAMVMDPERYGIEGAFVTGVSMEVPPDLVLAQFQLFNPDVRRIGVILGAGTERDSVEDAIATAREGGWQVLVRRVGSERDVRSAFNHLINRVDAFWLLPDPVVVTPANFHLIRNATVRARMPLLAYSETLVEAGALMCVAPDPSRTGEQAADLVREVLAGRTAGVLPPAVPDQPRVVLNRDTQEAIGLHLDPAMLDFVDEVVRQPTRR